MAFTVSWALGTIQPEDAAVIPAFSGERRVRLYLCEVRDCPVEQYVRKTVGDQGFLGTKVLLLTLEHAVH